MRSSSSAFMSWFGRGKSKATQQAPMPPMPNELAKSVEFQNFASRMLTQLPSLEQEAPDLDLTRARIADAQRDLAQRPQAPEEFMARVLALPREAQARLTLAAAGLVPEVVASLERHGADAAHILFEFSNALHLLTPEMLLESPLRREEFVRHFLAATLTAIKGETSQESAERLARLDYGALMAAAEKAKGSAEERMAYLRKLREEQERRLAPRGKI